MKAHTESDPQDVLCFHEIGSRSRLLVGGKGANLAELSRIKGIRVPDGFCVSTNAFSRVVGQHPAVRPLLSRLSMLKADEKETIRSLSREIRKKIRAIVLPEDLRNAVCRQLSAMGKENAYAVRSSATAEDLPEASFAGQQESYLNISGTEAVLSHVRECWASLFTDRAVMYRLQNGLGDRPVQMAVVVQEMVYPRAAGVLFTADPLSGNRRAASIDAGSGLGDVLVSGKTNPDNYRVEGDVIIRRPAAGSGPSEGPVLRDEEIRTLVRLGRKIETHFGQPQDIEWCLKEGEFYFVQSRPITTLFPIPEAEDQNDHVYVSVGHQQMMTDAIKPLGISFWQMTALRPFSQAGGRLFIDVSPMLASKEGREMILNGLGKSDPLIKDALHQVLARKGIPEARAEQHTGQLPPFNRQTECDPAIVPELIARGEKAISSLRQTIASHTGVGLFDFIEENMQHLRNLLSDPQSLSVITTGINVSTWINDQIAEWLGEKNVADTLSQSAPNNITSEMGRALLDVADAIRPYPEIIAYLETVPVDASGGQAPAFPDELLQFQGGKVVHQAVLAYLEKYGMRCAGEIDITRTRWSEHPSILIPLLLSNLKNFPPNAGREKFEQGLRNAEVKERELLARLKSLPGGLQKARETSRMIRLLRNLIGYREYPKYVMVNHFYIYKQALMKEADGLLQSGLIRDREDVFYLTFEEFRQAVATHRLEYPLISRRKAEHARYLKLTPPRVIASDGEIINGEYTQKSLPPAALPGIPVSSGLAEGRARVLHHMAEADLEAGDILVTSFTDPSWTPAFLSIKGLVTEVGGLMTHGAVVAREYGLPAVVGVANATRLIKDGQRIRVHGTEGYVEILGYKAEGRT